MKRTILVLSVALLFMLLVGTVHAQRGGGVGWVRFAHASVDAEEVSITVNGDDWIDQMEYGVIYLYSPLEEGDYDLEFDIGNNDFDDNLDFTLTVEAEQSYTVMVIGSVDDGTLNSTYLPEDLYFTDEDSDEDFSQVMILNALDEDGFDVVDRDDGDNIWFEIREMPFVGWNYLDGEWNLDITEPGDEGDVLLEDITSDLDFPAGGGFRYLLVVAGTRRNPDLFTFVSGYRTINEILNREGDLSTLADAVSAIDFDTSLESDGNYTLFAPTDDAFDNFADDNNMDINDLLDDNDAVTELLSYHLLLNYSTMESLADDGEADTALDGESLQFDLDRDDWLVVNDVTVTRWIPAINGVVYVIEEVLAP